MSQVHGNAAVMEAMSGATESLTAVGESMSVKDIMNMMKNYSKEAEKMGLKQEMMEDAMEMAMDTDNVNEDSEQIYS